MKFYLGMRTWIWNMDRLHKIYKITFPCGNTYVGSTFTTFQTRYKNHRSRFKFKPTKPMVNEISEKHTFGEVKMIELDSIRCVKGDPEVRILEEKWKRKLNPTLNIRKAHITKEEKIKYFREKAQEYNNKPEVKEKLARWFLTPEGKRTSTINHARQYIKLYTKQNRPDMVKKWEGILKERLK